MPRGRLSSRAAASSLALAQLAAMAAWLSSAAFEAAFAYAAALFGGGYAGGGGGVGSGPCACLCAVRLAAQSRAIAPMSALPIIAAVGCAACTGASAEFPQTPPVTWVPNRAK